MQIRTTERNHAFTQELFRQLHIFSIEGLTMRQDRSFSACIEAIQFEPQEAIDLSAIFPIIKVRAKYYLAQKINIPLYFVIHQKEYFKVYEIETKPSFKAIQRYQFDTLAYIKWWATLKGLKQPKPLFEATERVRSSIFDQTLIKSNMAWGGNIDGFLFKNKKLAAIIENIYTQKHPLESPKGEPSYYFHKRGPNYNTWLPTVLLAQKLNVPLFLFTIEGNSIQPRIGFTVIKQLSKRGIEYLLPPPNQNILSGIKEIKTEVLKYLTASPPLLV